LRHLGEPGEPIFEIDRDRGHPIGLIREARARQIGCLKFDTPGNMRDDGRKLIDLRPLQSSLLWFVLADDYPEKGFVAAGPALPEWNPDCGAGAQVGIAVAEAELPPVDCSTREW
jgi:hypothetical protein